MEFSRNYHILTYGPEMINVLSRPIWKEDYDALKDLRDYMVDAMRRAGGIGLSAPQIGVFKQLILVQNEYDDVIDLVNPEITRLYGKEYEMPEGCLSIPPAGNECPVPRMESVEISASTVERPDVERTFKFHRMTARVAQHEIDHLYGTFFVDRVQDKKRKAVLDTFKYWQSFQAAKIRKPMGGRYVDAGVVATHRGQSRLS